MGNDTLASLRHALEEAQGHLGTSIVQRAPSDDRIIAEHIESAYHLILRAGRLVDALTDTLISENMGHN